MLSVEECKSELRAALHQYPNFPRQGVLFEDFLTIFKNPSLFRKLIEGLKTHIEEEFPPGKIDYIVAPEARGFLVAPTLAFAMDIGFIPIRKAGKLPGEVVSVEYEMEYGEAVFELQKEAIPPGSNVLLVDDILATGGSAVASTELLRQVDANVLGYCFIMELEHLKGRARLNEAPVFALLNSQSEGLMKK
ncbi:Adenine phosphoribosyltransferase 1 [Nakaseomyces bracarensis]|uniref:adenine phosphoribosyltransferase n=1 Tax=Nakaseomyces bracarensis TaxID=273131 RepID=A0ABR4NZT7_9SACH